MAETASPLPRTLHTDQFIVAEYGGALLPRSDAESIAARCLPRCRGVDHGSSINIMLHVGNITEEISDGRNERALYGMERLGRLSMISLVTAQAGPVGPAGADQGAWRWR